MLPELMLDNENFDEILNEAKNMVISLYPDWTDFNYHDPGITLLELFSWLRENQQYHIDQISIEHRKKYLKLLGMSQRHRTPASLYVHGAVSRDSCVPKGTRLHAGPICFELEEKKQLIKGDVEKCFTAGRRILQMADKKQMESGMKLNMRLFDSADFYIAFKNPLAEKTGYSLYLKIAENRPVSRNPVVLPMEYPIAVLRLEYYGRNGWIRAEHFLDGTAGALITGRLEFTCSEPMEETTVFGEPGYYLRLIPESSSYDVEPVLEELSMNVMLLEQKEHFVEQQDIRVEDADFKSGCCVASTALAMNERNNLYLLMPHGYYMRLTGFTKVTNYEEGRAQFFFDLPDDMKAAEGIRIISHSKENTEKMLLACADGLPFQEYDLDDKDVEYHSFGLMVQDGNCPTRYLDWNRVEDFGGSGPEDRDYILDTENGRVIFGDCIHGMAPEGDIIITNYVRTLGRKGNIKSYQIQQIDGLNPADVSVCNHTGGSGGTDEETLEECFLRARRMLKHSHTAVTDKDCERRVMETPGLILESCKVIGAGERKVMGSPGGPELAVVVKPFSEKENPGLSRVYQDNIRSYLERFLMVGRNIRLMPPRNIVFEVCGDIVLKPHFVEARKMVRETVEAFFKDIDKQFGASVSGNRLYGYIDRLPCVAGINSLTVDAKGNGVIKNADGTIKLPPDGIARLGDVQYLFSIQ